VDQKVVCLSDRKFKRDYPSMCAIGDRYLMVSGGDDGCEACEMYDIESGEWR